MMDLKATASITFFYYDSLEAADNFYANTLGLELVDDQEWTKIFRIQGNAYLGIVSGKRGFHRVQDTNAVLLTLVVQDVETWYEKFSDGDVRILREIETHDDIQVRCFFAEDPGGYAIEIQTFLKPAIAEAFGL